MRNLVVTAGTEEPYCASTNMEAHISDERLQHSSGVGNPSGDRPL